jgi:hypothetical protein
MTRALKSGSGCGNASGRSRSSHTRSFRGRSPRHRPGASERRIWAEPARIWGPAWLPSEPGPALRAGFHCRCRWSPGRAVERALRPALPGWPAGPERPVPAPERGEPGSGGLRQRTGRERCRPSRPGSRRRLQISSAWSWPWSFEKGWVTMSRDEQARGSNAER